MPLLRQKKNIRVLEGKIYITNMQNLKSFIQF